LKEIEGREKKRGEETCTTSHIVLQKVGGFSISGKFQFPKKKRKEKEINRG